MLCIILAMSADDKKNSSTAAGAKPKSIWKKLGLFTLGQMGFGAANTAAVSALRKNMINNLTEDASFVKKMMEASHKLGDIRSDTIKPVTDLGRSAAETNAFYHPMTDLIYASDNLKTKPAIIAHELGHASNGASKNLFNKIISNAYPVSTQAPGLSSLVNLIGMKKLTTKQMYGINGVGTGLFAPALLEEALASYKGYKNMRNNGAGVLSSLGAFSGFPSYVMQGVMPYVQTYLQSKTGLTKDTWNK